MSRGGFRRPGRPATVSGVGLLSFLVFGLVVVGCEGAGDRPPDPELEGARALGLASDARLHSVTLGGRGAQEHAVPARVQAVPGDAVEFRTVDHRVHTLVFLSDSLSVDARSFLEATGQMASPPLVTRGSRFLLRLEGAPRGRYVFRSEGHGGAAFGVVEVGRRSDPDSTGRE